MKILLSYAGNRSQRLPARYSCCFVSFADKDVASASCMTNIVPNVGYRLGGLPDRLLVAYFSCLVT